jgi:hypothetical protein
LLWFGNSIHLHRDGAAIVLSPVRDIRHDAHAAQHEADPPLPERSICFGGHGTEPKEQNTQQSPGSGLNFVPHPVHV